MTITLYELCGAETARVFSPYCWRIRLALAHKGLDFNSAPLMFTDLHVLDFSGQRKVPVIRDEGQVIADSWTIADHLEAAWPDRPALFASGRGHAEDVRAYVDKTLTPAIFPGLILDIHARLAPEAQAYFRTTREARLGMPLERFADPDGARARFDAALAPMRARLADQPWLGGGAPDFCDYMVGGIFFWARGVARSPVLARSDAAAGWFEALMRHHHAVVDGTIGTDKLFS